MRGARPWRPRLVAAAAAALVGLGALGAAGPAAASSTSPSASPSSTPTDTPVEGVREEPLTVPVGPEPGGAQVTIDATIYEPDAASQASPSPAVLLAHGFGGSKADLAAQGRSLAQAGYVALAYTARGFGASGGNVHLDDPDYEVADARALVDLLAQRPEVQQDGPGDPRVGVAGASYGGAVGLLLAGTDPRVDAVASGITWSDLSSALDPQAAQGQSGGVFKAGWASQLLTSLTGSALDSARSATSATATASGTSGTSGGGTGGGAQLGVSTAACGRLAPDLCRGYLQAAETGVVPDSLRAQLARSAPAAVLPDSRAAVLLVQGEGDSLFGLGDSLANAEAAQRSGAPVSVAWVGGGHDGGFDGAAFDDRARTWFDEHLRAGASAGAQTGEPAGSGESAGDPTAAFSVAVPRQSLFGGRGGGGGGGGGSTPDERTLDAVPPLAGTAQQLALSPAAPSAQQGQGGQQGQQGPQLVLSPAGGRPAAMTALPGLGDVASLVGLAAGGGFNTAVLPGQAAVFETEPLEQPLTLLGASSVRLSVTSNADDAVLFASLSDVSPDGSTALPSGLVAPLRVTTTPGQPATVDVTLPAVVRDVAAGHRLRLVVATTDSAYAVPTDPRVYGIGLADGQLAVAAAPAAISEPTGDSVDVPRAHVLALAGVVLAALALALVDAARRRRRPAAGGAHDDAPQVTGAGRDDLDDVVLEVSGLEKVYGDGFRAVDGGVVHRAPRAGGRAARSQRRRQDHHAAHAHGPAPAERRVAGGARAARQARVAGAGTGRCARGGAGVPAAPVGAGEPAAVLGVHGAPGSRRALRGGPRGRRARRRRAPARARLQPGHAAAAGHRPGDARLPGPARARRADQRPRPAADHRHAPGAARLRRHRPHGARLLPPALGGGGHLQPRGGDGAREGAGGGVGGRAGRGVG
ncbi:MAG: alpha/beta fold hydrolase [Quadrisphaera sp.]